MYEEQYAVCPPSFCLLFVWIIPMWPLQVKEILYIHH